MLKEVDGVLVPTIFSRFGKNKSIDGVIKDYLFVGCIPRVQKNWAAPLRPKNP